MASGCSLQIVRCKLGQAYRLPGGPGEPCLEQTPGLGTGPLVSHAPDPFLDPAAQHVSVEDDPDGRSRTPERYVPEAPPFR